MIRIHLILIFGIGILWILGKTGLFLPRPFTNPKGRRIFYLVALGGNILGFLLGIQSNQNRVYTEEVRFEKGETLTKEYELRTDSLEETVELRVLVPAKDSEETEEVYEETEDLKKELEEEITRLNQEKEDPDYYYLPVSFKNTALVWEKPEDLSGAVLGLLSLMTGVLLLLLAEREKLEQAQKREERLLSEYPEFIMKFTLLLEAGLTARSAFERIGTDSLRLSGERTKLSYSEVRSTCHEMESGVTEKEAYRHFAARCAQTRYRTFVSLLNQNLQKGSAQLLELLEKESYDAWSERRRRAKVEGEKATTRLLFPMILMLVVVIAVIMIPAFLSFYGGA